MTLTVARPGALSDAARTFLDDGLDDPLAGHAELPFTVAFPAAGMESRRSPYLLMELEAPGERRRYLVLERLNDDGDHAPSIHCTEGELDGDPSEEEILAFADDISDNDDLSFEDLIEDMNLAYDADEMTIGLFGDFMWDTLFGLRDVVQSGR